MEKFKRRKYFIREGSQFRLIVGIQAMFIILVLISNTMFYLAADRDLTESYFKAHLRIKHTMELLLPSMVLFSLLGLVISAFINILFTHRIAGPVFRFCRMLRGVGEGNLTQRVKFRDYDELHELPKAANLMLDGLSMKLGRLKELSDSIKGKMVSLHNQDNEQELKQLTERVTEMQGILSQFKLRENPAAAEEPGKG